MGTINALKKLGATLGHLAIIIVMVFTFLMGVVGITQSKNDSFGFGLGIFFVVIGIGCLCFLNMPFLRGFTKVQKDFKQSKSQSFQEIGFHVSKELNINGVSFPKGEFLVDDVSKRFALRYIRSSKGTNLLSLYKYEIVLRVLNFSDLGAFELLEDGNSVISGKGVATAVGALTFGIAGAFVGSSGKRKTQNTCCHLSVRMLINDLQSPQIDVNFVSSEVSKSSVLYKEKYKQAQELTATLSYIAANS